MSLSAPIAALCCFSLLGLGTLLGVAIYRRPGQRIAAYQAFGGSAAAMAGIPVAVFLHPRMDLATGRAPRHQSVNLGQRRRRHELSEIFTTVVEPATAFEPFEQRRKHAKPLRQRLDLVYARDTMGDLSDPVCRKRLAA